MKPWQCKICNCNFNQARDLKAHQMQKHSGERPHICKVNRSSFLILVCIMFQKVGFQSCDIFLTLCFIYNNQIILGATLAFQSLLANRNFLFAFKCRKRIKWTNLIPDLRQRICSQILPKRAFIISFRLKFKFLLWDSDLHYKKITENSKGSFRQATFESCDYCRQLHFHI